MRVVIQNFRHYSGKEPRVFDFADGEITLLRGNSGSGKTTVFLAIVWCLFGGLRGNALKPIAANQKAAGKSPAAAEIAKFGAGPSATAVIIHIDGPIIRPRSAAASSLEVELVPSGEHLVLTGTSAASWVETTFGTKVFWQAGSYMPQGGHNPLISLSNAEKFSLLFELAFGGKPAEGEDAAVSASPDSIMTPAAAALSIARSAAAEKAVATAAARDAFDREAREVGTDAYDDKLGSAESISRQRAKIALELSSAEKALSESERVFSRRETLVAMLETITKSREAAARIKNDNDGVFAEKLVSIGFEGRLEPMSGESMDRVTDAVRVLKASAGKAGKAAASAAVLSAEIGVASEAASALGRGTPSAIKTMVLGKIADCWETSKESLSLAVEEAALCFLQMSVDCTDELQREVGKLENAVDLKFANISTSDLKFEASLRERFRAKKTKTLKCTACGAEIDALAAELAAARGEAAGAGLSDADLARLIKSRAAAEAAATLLNCELENKQLRHCLCVAKENDIAPCAGAKRAVEAFNAGKLHGVSVAAAEIFSVLYRVGDSYPEGFDAQVCAAMRRGGSAPECLAANSKDLDTETAMRAMDAFIPGGKDWTHADNVVKTMNAWITSSSSFAADDAALEKQERELRSAIRVGGGVGGFATNCPKEIAAKVQELRAEVESLAAAGVRAAAVRRRDDAAQRLKAAKAAEVEVLARANAAAELLKFSSSVASDTLETMIGDISKIANLVLAELFDQEFPMRVELEILQKKTVTTSSSAGNAVSLSISHRGADYDGASLLSGGETDRLSIALTVAMAIVARSKFLLLDESMSSVTAEQKERCLAALRKFLPARTILEISHIEVPSALYDAEIKI